MIREMKNIGGMDTVGVEIGADSIIQRAKKETAEVLGDRQAAQIFEKAKVSRGHICDYVPLVVNGNDADQAWWTPLSSHDNDMEQQARVSKPFFDYLYSHLY